MSFLCCGIEYKKSNPATYWCIETDLIKPQTLENKKIKELQEYVKNQLIAVNKKKYESYIPREFIKKRIDDKPIIKEMVQSLTCKKNGCIKVKITRYYLDEKNKNKKIGNDEEFKGNEAYFYIDAIMRLNIGKRLKQRNPLKAIPSATKIPPIFPEAISKTEQKLMYLMSNPIRADKFKPGIIPELNKWVPNIINSEIKVIVS